MIALDFAHTPALVGVLHLPPLPGSPRWLQAGCPAWETLDRRVEADARRYAEAGVDGLIVENFGDAPFFKTAPPETVAALTRLARVVRAAAPNLPLGINVLRNDAHAALAIAVAAQAQFIRVNVHTGIAATDQGLSEGRAAETARLREALGAGPNGPHPVALFADVHVKHARTLHSDSLPHAAVDTARRGLADAVIVSGIATGSPPSPDDLRAVRDLDPTCPLWLGSGLTPARCAELAPLLDGAIAASYALVDGQAGNPVDPERARHLVTAFREATAAR